MKVLFMGTPDFAVPCLRALTEDPHYQVVGVFTQPDKPQGRKMVLTAPPVKQYALEQGYPVFQPEKMKDGTALAQIQQWAPDVIVVVAFGRILPKEILDYPPYGCINIHGSLLPKYRGAGPIQWCVLNGEELAGVTSMQMAEGLDTGDMLLKTSTPIGENETAVELFDRLKELAAENLLRTLEGLKAGTLTPEPQKEAESSYAPMLKKEMALIDFSQPAQTVHNHIRGMNSWPVAYTFAEGRKLKVFTSRMGGDSSALPGTVLEQDREKGLRVACGQGSVWLLEAQLEGKKRMTIDALLRGFPLPPGTVLGQGE
ncbi:MAG: methionyl-tRNA formyltransferase [Eubacteriales bacterium]|jgi:methionyl-tRNA formyltransferase